MKLRATASALLLAFSDSGIAAEHPSVATAPNESPAAPGSIGVARMLPDRTILIGVPGPGTGDRARAVLSLMPGDTQYQPLLDHIGGLNPGETKSIPPWPEPSPPRNAEEPLTPSSPGR